MTVHHPMQSNALRGVRVLITRPEPQAKTMAERIQQYGGQPLRLPVMQITQPEPDILAAAKTTLRQLDTYNFAIFISQNAVHYSHKLAPFPWPTPQPELISIGKATSNALKTYGITAELTPINAFHSETLLDQLKFRVFLNKKVIILRGNGGREYLRDMLLQRGAHVDYAEVYQRVIPEIDESTLANTLKPGAIDIISITSDQGLRNLVTLAGERYLDAILPLPLVVNSQRSVKLALSLGFNNTILLAQSPGAEGHVEAIINWNLQQQASE